MTKRILIMAGGTGGHVIPALSVAKALELEGFSIEWLGTARGIEADLVPAANFPLNQLSIAGLRGKGKLGLLASPWRIIKAIAQALKVIRRFKPDAVLGFGGYAAGPGGVAARLAGVPLLIHEQNAIAGLTNKLLSRISQQNLQGFPDALPQALTVGNPVRAQVIDLPAPELRYQERMQAPLNVLVVGGSLGAAALNRVVLDAMHSLPVEARPNLQHQVGKAHWADMQTLYDEHQVTAEVVPFIDDMAAAYAWADLVVCRAGALTVAEVAAAGCAALFVPFPFAVDDHQTANANFLVGQQAALLVQQKELTSDYLANLWQRFSADKTELLKMAVNAKQHAIVDATAAVVEQIKRVSRG